MTALALDPGKTTGIAWWFPGHKSEEVSNGFDGFVEWSLDAPWGLISAVVVESFIINPATHKKDPGSFETTTSIIGAVRYICATRNIPCKLQPPSAKVFGSDEKLRRLGWYSPSKGGHQNDASRHLLKFLADARTPEILDALST